MTPTGAERFLQFQEMQQSKTGCKELGSLLMQVHISVDILPDPVLIKHLVLNLASRASLTPNLTLSADPARDALRTVAESAARQHS